MAPVVSTSSINKAARPSTLPRRADGTWKAPRIFRLRALAEGISPWLWAHVVRVVLDQPVFAVMGVLGILLMLLFRPRKPLIGYSRN